MDLTFKKLKQSLIKIIDKSSGYKKKTMLKTFQLPNGLVETFFIDQDKDSVSILPITKDKHVALIRQFRAGLEKVGVELPGGGLEALEDPLEAAVRELKEECGMEADEMVHLCSVPYNPYSSGIRHCYMGLGCVKVGDKDLDPNEFLDVFEIGLDEFRDKIKKAEIRGYEMGYLGLDKLGLL